MKNAIKEYINLTNKEKESLWKDATFVGNVKNFV